MSEIDKNNETSEVNLDPVKIKDSWLWVRNSKGDASVSTTLLLVAFVLTSVSFVLNMFDGQIFGFTLKSFDTTAVAVYFNSLLLLYFGRRFTENKDKK